MIRTTLIFLAVLLIVAALAFAAYVRLSPMDPTAWHVDPATTPRTDKPNDYLVADGGDRDAIVVAETPEAVLTRLDAAAMAEPGVSRLAGSVADGRVTYVQRTPMMRYPDAISVSAVPDGDGAKLSLYSRSRYGQSDFGVNRARVERWLATLGL